jgi:cytochrome c553
MSLIAQMLSNEDIENVAEWYSKIKISIELPLE